MSLMPEMVKQLHRMVKPLHHDGEAVTPGNGEAVTPGNGETVTPEETKFQETSRRDKIRKRSTEDRGRARKRRG